MATQVGDAADRDLATWMLDRQGGEPRRLTLETSRVWNLAVHPDGTRLVFSDGDLPPNMWRVEGLENLLR